jgi:hypothetical protein
MSRSLLVASLLAFSAASVHAGDPETVPLCQAAKDGLVTVEVLEVQGHQRAHLRIKSKTDKDVAIDVNGSYLEPPDGPKVQPLGLGLVDGELKPVVSLAAHATVEPWILTVCMNLHAASPASARGFKLAKEKAEGAVGKALAAWREHPETQQGLVQSAAWGRGDSSPARPERREEPPGPRRPPSPVVAAPVPLEGMDLPAGTSRVAVIAGEVFALTETGTLSSANPECEWVETGTDVLDFVADRTSVHALFANRVARWFVYGSGKWAPELEGEERGRLLWATEGAALLDQGGEVRLVGPKGLMRSFAAGSFVVPGEKDLVVATPGNGATELVRVKHEGTFSFEASSVAAVLSAATSKDGLVLGLTTDRRLVRDEDGTVEQWGRARALLAGPGGRILLETERGLRLELNGKGRDLPAPRGANLVFDAVKGDLYAWSGVELERWAPELGSWQRVRFKR